METQKMPRAHQDNATVAGPRENRGPVQGTETREELIEAERQWDRDDQARQKAEDARGGGNRSERAGTQPPASTIEEATQRAHEGEPKADVNDSHDDEPPVSDDTLGRPARQRAAAEHRDQAGRPVSRTGRVT
jgi:hypothetical protein